jgi:exodeoxyribonuclease V alpha subunit
MGSPKANRPWENESPEPINAAIPERRPATEEISGLVERVTFHNDESGFCVLRVKARGQREETTVVGSLPSVTAGEWLSAEGWWGRDKEHGLQFKATTMKTVPPTTAEGIERYLGSGLVKGIGPILAKELVGRFGAEVLAVIENRAAELNRGGITAACDSNHRHEQRSWGY